MKLFQYLLMIAALSHPWGDNNSIHQQSGNSVILSNGSEYKTVQECVKAAALRNPPGSCTVSSGATNTAELEMASGVEIVFGKGTFINSSRQGGQSSFVHFGRNVHNASVCGLGQANTTLENDRSAPQFGAVIEDEGTNNTVCNITLNGNNNSTDTLLDLSTHGAKVHNVKLIGDLVSDPRHSYSWDIRGGGNFEGADIEVLGGSLDAIQLTTKDFNGEYGNIVGGYFTRIYAHESPRNGIDFNANGERLSISGTVWTKIRLIDNGTANDGTDDEYGLDLFATETTHSTISDNTFVHLVARGNKGSGIRLKGNVMNNVFLDVSSVRNGEGRPGTVHLSSIQLATEIGTAAPSSNWFEGHSRGSRRAKALTADANARNNDFCLK